MSHKLGDRGLSQIQDARALNSITDGIPTKNSNLSTLIKAAVWVQIKTQAGADPYLH